MKLDLIKKGLKFLCKSALTIIIEKGCYSMIDKVWDLPVWNWIFWCVAAFVGVVLTILWEKNQSIDENIFNFINDFLPSKFIPFREATSIICDATNAVNDYPAATTEENRYGYCAHQIIPLAQKKSLSIYKQNYPGKKKIKLLLNELTNVTADYEGTFIKKRELMVAIQEQKRLVKLRDEYFNTLNALEEQGFKGSRDYCELKEKYIDVQNKVVLHFSKRILSNELFGEPISN